MLNVLKHIPGSYILQVFAAGWIWGTGGIMNHVISIAPPTKCTTGWGVEALRLTENIGPSLLPQPVQNSVLCLLPHFLLKGHWEAGSFPAP
jgi:membrane-bound metal-dependent hydrolase YbcI (DUF457 family)